MGSQGLSQIMMLALSVILVRLVDKETVGTYRQVFLVFTFLSGMFSLSINNSLFYFIPRQGLEGRGTLLKQSMLVTLVMAAGMGGMMYGAAEIIGREFQNAELAGLLRIFALYPLVERVMNLVPAFMIGIDRAGQAGFYTVMGAVSRIAAVVVVLGWGYSLAVVMWALIVTGGVLAIAGWLDMVRRCPKGGWGWSKDLLKEQIAYCWPLLATGMAGTLNVEMNKVLISIFFGSVIYAEYSCGAIQLPTMHLVAVSITSAMIPELTGMLEKRNIAGAIRLWQEAMRKCSLIIYPCFGFLLVTGYDIIVLFYTQEYARGSWPFITFLFVLPIRVTLHTALFMASGNTRYIAMEMALVLTLNLGLSLLFVKTGGEVISFIGPMLGMVAASWVGWGYMMGKICKITGERLGQIVRWKELLVILGISLWYAAVVWVLGRVIGQVGLLARMPLAAKLMLEFVVYAGVYVMVMWGGNLLKEDEKRMLHWPVKFIRQLGK